jgi:light-regulated signal transduction histidine kinase (bacteriophytochrome)
LHDFFKKKVLEDILTKLSVSKTENYIGIFESFKGNESILNMEISSFELQFENEQSLLIIFHDVTSDLENRSQIIELTKNLEKKVQERTIELKNANDELEAFTYSVSHDLRAPLRAIDGFSQAVIDDHGNTLDKPALNYLIRVRQASQKMSVLIDDLLRLSRISRTSISLKMVDLTELANQIIDQEKRVYPENIYQVTLEQGLTITTDEGLARILLENLISNAFKYSSKTENPCIHFGRSQIENQGYFFVRDNGIGFDPQHKEKILQPFQRLHMDTEYQGIGVGLATVDRIIKKLKGDLLIESSPGQGSTFYFHLGENT